MTSLLDDDIMTSLDVIQSELTDISECYHVDNIFDFSCVRCSGSAGRYVYEQDIKQKPPKKEEK
jgi:hypothetical protein